MIQAIKRLWSGMLPPERPNVELGYLLRIADESGVNIEKEVCLIAIRGFYNKGQNQRGIYDDAIFLVKPTGVMAFNANVDPGVSKDGIAQLDAGVWSYMRGIHGLSKPKEKQYEALVQAKEVRVTRDNKGTDYGYFGINIHRGSKTSVSSEGCQTIHPDQWDEFIKAVMLSMVIRKQRVIKYILKEMNDEIY